MRAQSTAMTGSHWREARFYPALGVVSLLSVLYLNFGDHLSFPIVLWGLPAMSFVGVDSTQFVLRNGSQQERRSPVYVNGWNSYWLMEESVWAPSRWRVSEMMKRGAEMGMGVCRTWAFSDGDGPNALQSSPGVFNERAFRGLDFVIVEARKHRAIVTRKNSLSGVPYSDEPAIFAWELINEPRCEDNSSAPALQAWIKEMAAFVKGLDPNHLVTVGLEGFYGMRATESDRVNPGEWAASLGSDFIQNSAIDDIDFASVHAYPHSWLPTADFEERINYLSHWVDVHISDAENVLKKPVLFTELGAPLRMEEGEYDRDVLLRTAYDKIYESA